MARLGSYAPPIALMVLIYAFSAQPSLSSGLGEWDLLLRKLAHMTEYGLLWVLLWRATRQARPGLTAALAIGYAVTDEWHQTFVEGRHGTPVDVAIDALGVGLAAALVVGWSLRASRARRP